jgi:hypothetical protein
MPPINDSKDLLYIVISISVLGLTFFICWSIYYFAMILRQSLQIIKEARSWLHKVDDMISSFKEKIEHSASYLPLIGEGVKKLIEIMKNRAEKKKKSKKKEE